MTFIKPEEAQCALRFIKIRMGEDIDPKNFTTYGKQFTQVVRLLQLKLKREANESINVTAEMDTQTYSVISRYPIMVRTLSEDEKNEYLIQLIRLLLYIRGYSVGLHAYWEVDLERALKQFRIDNNFELNNDQTILVSRNLWGYLLDRKKVKKNG